MTVLEMDSDTEHAKSGAKNPNNVRMTLASVENLTLPLVQEVVLLADFSCKGCQEKVATIMSRMNGETVSIEVSILEKKVTLTCIYPASVKTSAKQVATIYKNPVNNFSLIRRLFRSSCT